MPMISISSIVRRPSFMRHVHVAAARGRSAPRRGLVVGFLIACELAACSPDQVIGNTPLPPDVPDPAETQTPAGAMAAYRGTLVQFRMVFGGDPYSFIPVAGLVTDELGSRNRGLVGSVTVDQLVDSRSMPEEPTNGKLPTTVYATLVDQTYSLLQKVRGQARQARGALRAYAPDSSPAYTGHLDALEGYAELFLADLFCSGIPLSTLDFNGDYTVAPGSTTEEVYQHAAALFDSALTLGASDEQVLNLSRVGKGRALLALGQYVDAAAAVTAVPDGFEYAVRYSTVVSPGVGASKPRNANFVEADFRIGAGGLALTMVDREGGNGLAYLSSGDPRTPWVDNGKNNWGIEYARPANYSTTGDTPLVVASGIEARLIEAEAQLQAGDDGWLATLNALRTDGTFTTQPNPDDSTKTDTLWNAGTGGVAGLAPLADPGDPDARVDLIFDERAFWLFLTGHRQGDLRRLIRVYGRDPETVYPTGQYPGANGIYGSDVTAPIPSSERNNPLFTGCSSRGA